MTNEQLPETHLQLRSTVKSEGVLELSLEQAPVPSPGPDDVLIQVQASPINPSDLGMLFGPADMSTARSVAGRDTPAVQADIPEKLLRSVAGRIDQPMPVGNEGAGLVVATGSSSEAQALLGKTVAVLGGGMYAQYRKMKAAQCLLLPEGTTAREGASCFVNPLTALGMTETMRLEGHSALVHTAAASNLGQMLNKICLADEIPLVNIVRKPEQEELLRDLGARYVCNSGKDSFMTDLIEALAETGATLAFDAVGGGKLASQILSAMEAAASRNADSYSRYGSTVHKQVYIYGGLDRGPTQLNRGYGMAWGVGGWLLPPFLERIGPEAAQRLRERVANELKTTFASSYSREIDLAEAVSLEAIQVYGKQATGEKYLVTPDG